MTTKRLFMAASAALLSLGAAAQVEIDIDAQQRGPRVSPMLYGIFYEDINHAADGGLYAELIRNRSFEDGPRFGAPADMQAWSTYAAAPSQLTATLIQHSKKTPLLNSVQHNALQLDIKASTASPVCLVNEGFWGINTVQGRTYKLTFWAKATKYKGTVKATLCSKDGKALYAESVVSGFPADKPASILPFRAFLLPSARNAAARISMTLEDEDATDIDSIETIDEDGTRRYYDLNGRELQGKPVKGVYIYKGKTYINK